MRLPSSRSRRRSRSRGSSACRSCGARTPPTPPSRTRPRSGSYTWHWGRTDLQDPNDIHYTAAGKTWIARWVERYMRGSETWYDTPWTPLTVYGNGYGGFNGSGWNTLEWCRRDGLVHINGAFNKAGAWTQDAILLLPLEARPRMNVSGAGCDVDWLGNLSNSQTGSGAGTCSATYSLL